MIIVGDLWLLSEKYLKIDISVLNLAIILIISILMQAKHLVLLVSF